MGRIRSLKPEFHSHEELSSLPPETHLLAAALLNYADDDGYFNANPVLVKAGTTPLRVDRTPIDEQISQLEKIGYLEIRREGNRAIGRILSFANHQRVSHPTPTKFAEKFEGLPKLSGEATEVLRPELNRREQGTGKGTASAEMPPEAVAKAVQVEAGIFGMKSLMVLTEVCKRELALGLKPEQVRDGLVEAWRKFELARADLQYAWGAEKFFGEGNWKNDGGWPWKEGKHGSSKQNQPVRASAAAQRRDANLTGLASVAARRYGVGPLNPVGASDGTIPESGSSGTDAGDVPSAVGGSGAQVRNRDVPGRVIEGHSD